MIDDGIPAQTDDDIIDECRRRFQLAQEAEAVSREQGIYDKKFLNGDQWETPVRNDRTLSDRPCLTINITAAVRNRVVNACRENRPRIKVHPVGDGADVQTAKLRDGLIRAIENDSNADYAYDCAVENAIDMGWGYLGLDGEFEEPDSFDQVIKVIGFANPFICYRDPASRMPDGSDMRWFVETTMMRREEYRQKFGNLDQDGWSWMGRGDNIANWSNKEEIRVAKYWRIETKLETIVKLSDGRAMRESELFSDEAMEALGLSVTATRRSPIPSVKCYLLTATKILERREYPGKYIPRVPVYGRIADIDGKIELKGMIRDLRDPARLYNYAQTAKTEAYAMQPKAPWLMAEGQEDGFESEWRDANRKAFPFLRYKPVVGPDGGLLPPPQRQMPPQPNAGFAEWGESTKSDFFHVAGMPHEPNQDVKGEVVSGVALRKRQGLSDISHYDFYDNLTRSLKHLGRIMLEWIPTYYDTERQIRIVREDGTVDQMKINSDPKTAMTQGKYEVVVDTGPSYQTKREESAEAMMELLGTPLGEMVSHTSGDLIVRAMDFPNADSVADRLVAAIPAAQMDKHSNLDPKAQAIIAGLQQQLQQAKQQNMALELEMHAKTGLEQMKQQGETQRLQMKEQGENYRAHLKSQTTSRDTHIKGQAALSVAEINAAGKIMDTHASSAHERSMLDRELEVADREEREVREA